MAGPGWEPDFIEYFTARAAGLRVLAYAMCGDWHQAEDITQNTFIKLYRHWRRIRPDTLEAYARRVLVNTFLSGRRTQHRTQLTDRPPDRAVPAADLAAGLDLHRVLLTLSPRQRAVLALRFLADLPVAEVADLLGMSVGTVKTHTSRGLEAMRAAMETPYTDQGVRNAR